jgi:BASS family bile acid:Na+ symporter
MSMRRLSIAAISALILLALVAAPTQAQEETEEEGNVIIDVILPLSLAFIMFSLGVGLTTEDFSLVIREPKAFGIGLANQMVVLPIMGFLIASAANLEGELAVGMMILACCPGGVTSNILTKLAKGDTALSISYTAVVSVATVITLPVIVGFSMDHFMGEAAPEIDILGLGITMFLLTTMPVLVGMAVRHYSPTKADSVEGGVNLVAAVLFVIIILAAIASEWDTLMDNIGTLGPAVIALNFLMLSIGYQSAKLLDLEIIRATTVSIESGIQNATVGITVGGLILAAPDGGLSTLSLPSGVYGVLMYLVIAPLIYWRINSNET